MDWEAGLRLVAAVDYEDTIWATCGSYGVPDRKWGLGLGVSLIGREMVWEESYFMFLQTIYSSL